MKITITIIAEEDGPCAAEEIRQIIEDRIRGDYRSEEVGKSDEWALLVESYDIEIEP